MTRLRPPDAARPATAPCAPTWRAAPALTLLLFGAACNGVAEPEGGPRRFADGGVMVEPTSPAAGDAPGANDDVTVGSPQDDGTAAGDPGVPGSGTDTPSGMATTDGTGDVADPEPAAPSPGLGDESGPGALPPGADPGGVDVECGMAPGVAPLLRLSTFEYRNTVRDVLVQSGIGAVATEIEDLLLGIPDDSLGDSFRSLDGRVSGEHIGGYFSVGVAIGDRVAGDVELLEAVAGDCALEDELTEQCARDFLQRFLGLAYRRPASDVELDELLTLREGRTASDAVRAMLVVALNSPRFINHFEIDGTVSDVSADVLQLTSYEIASRLSYTFWQTMPDAELSRAAADGSLATPEGFDAQLERVFGDPRTRETLWQFWAEWLRFEKFTGFETTRPAFEALAAGTAIGQEGHDYYGDMVQEVRDLTELFTFGRQSNLAALVTTDISVTRSADLAALYGVQPWDGAAEYPSLPAGTRGGVFQRAALLVSNLEQTNPFHRGAFVRRALLCDALPTPDPNSLPPGSLDPPPNDAAQTTRERFDAKVVGNGLCEGCHSSFSNIGYILESFDALGRHRTTELVYDEQNGDLIAELALDTSGAARIDVSDEAVVADAVELNQRLAESGKLEACLAERYFSFASRRVVEGESADACVVQDLATLLGDPEQGLAGAFRRIARHDAFFQRKVGAR
jgi:Protein of unknown function (DUF1592)/Protein of unknown function (DUF1588)/Protein of unknown function (DUF1595)/Protein of unknown function (DUF1585)